VKYGNCNYTELRNCTRLSQAELDRTIAPLISEKFLKKVNLGGTSDNQIRFIVTDDGEKFINFLGLAFNILELKDEN
jgi:hypothetical protein